MIKLANTTKSTLAGPDPATVTLVLSGRQIDYLDEMIQELNPEMPQAFGWPHAIRMLLDRIEASGIDLTAAGSEEEIAVVAAGKLRRQTRARRRFPTARSSSSARFRLAARREHPSILPGKDRCRSGKPPR